MNYSKHKEVIYKALETNNIHPTAERIHDFLKSGNYNVGIATVYRNLNQMADEGKILRIEGLDKSVHYDHNTIEHHHFICDGCTRVFDVDVSIAPDINKQTEKMTGFSIRHYEIVFQGICRECK